jgi:peroxiredoxin
MSELRGLGDVEQKLSEKGGKLVAISADDVQHARLVHDKLHLPFEVLSDASLNAIRAYGLFFHEPHVGKDTTLPAHFLIDKSGVVRWRFISPRSNDRPDPRDILKEVAKL